MPSHYVALYTGAIAAHTAHYFLASFLNFKISLSLPQYRGEVLDCLRRVVAGLGSSSSTTHRDIYKAVRNGLTDKAPHVRSSAAKVGHTRTFSSYFSMYYIGITTNC